MKTYYVKVTINESSADTNKLMPSRQYESVLRRVDEEGLQCEFVEATEKGGKVEGAQ